MQQKRVRSANFTPEEKLLCLNLIETYKSIVECKRIDAQTCKEKEEVWKKIEYEFNVRSVAGIKRTKESLKKCYENMKKRGKKPASENTARMGNNTLDEITNRSMFDETISDLNEKGVISLKSEFDDDGEDCFTLEEEIILPYDIENHTNYENNVDERENSEAQFNNKVHLREADAHLLAPKHTPDECITAEAPEKKKICSERSGISRRRPATAALTKKYENLATIKINCSNTQLDILRIEKKIALQKLKTEEEENERRKEEDERKKEDYERKKREAELQEEREEVLFKLKRQSLLLDVEIKKCQLRKLSTEKV